MKRLAKLPVYTPGLAVAIPCAVSATTKPSAFQTTGTTTRVSVAFEGSQGNDGSWTAVISADDRYVAFDSDGGNLVSGDTREPSSFHSARLSLPVALRASIPFDS